jgi:hypothetical protein
MNTMKISISQKFYSALYLWFYKLQVGPRGRTSRFPLIISLFTNHFALPSINVWSSLYTANLSVISLWPAAICTTDGRYCSVPCPSNPQLSGPVLDGCITDSCLRHYRHSTSRPHHSSDVFRRSLWFFCFLALSISGVAPPR